MIFFLTVNSNNDFVDNHDHILLLKEKKKSLNSTLFIIVQLN